MGWVGGTQAAGRRPLQRQHVGWDGSIRYEQRGVRTIIKGVAQPQATEGTRERPSRGRWARQAARRIYSRASEERESPGPLVPGGCPRGRGPEEPRHAEDDDAVLKGGK